jgi:hypothetical protein
MPLTVYLEISMDRKLLNSSNCLIEVIVDIKQEMTDALHSRQPASTQDSLHRKI